MRGPDALRRGMGILAAAALMIGCSTTRPAGTSDSGEAVLVASHDRVKAAVIQVLTEGGYEVSEGDRQDQVLSTGYRQEIASPWDWLVVHRFGTGRSRVDATILPESETTTRLIIDVAYEGKDSLFFSWSPYETPLPQSAANQLRLVRNALGLL